MIQYLSLFTGVYILLWANICSLPNIIIQNIIAVSPAVVEEINIDEKAAVAEAVDVDESVDTVEPVDSGELEVIGKSVDIREPVDSGELEVTRESVDIDESVDTNETVSADVSTSPIEGTTIDSNDDENEVTIPNDGTDISGLDSSWTIIDSTNSGADIGATIKQKLQEGASKICIRNGTYDSATTVDLEQDGIIITGESSDLTVINQVTNSVSFRINANHVTISDFTIKNQLLYALEVKNASNASVSNMIIYGSSNCTAVGFFGTTFPAGTDNIDIVENLSIDTGNEFAFNTVYSDYSGDGIYIEKQEQFSMHDNMIEGSRIAFSLSRLSSISNNNISNTQNNGIRCTVPSYSNTIEYNQIQNTVGAGISIVKYDGSIPDTYRGWDYHISNNTVEESSYFGLELSRLKDSFVEDNYIHNVDYSGIYLLYGDNLTVARNRITDVNRCSVNIPVQAWNGNLSAGIFLDYRVKDSLFDSNVQENLNNNCPYGIRLQSGGENTGNTIINNSATGHFEDTIYSDGTVTVAGNTSTLTSLIPTPVPTTIPDDSSIRVNWTHIAGYDNYDIDLDGTIVHCYGTNFYVDNGLALHETRRYRVRVSGGFWSDWVDGSTYEAIITVNASTEDGAYTGNWTNKDVTLLLQGVTSYLTYQYSLTPEDGSSWQNVSGDTMIIQTEQNDQRYYFRAIASDNHVMAQTDGIRMKVDKTPLNLMITGNPDHWVSNDVLLFISKVAGPSGITSVTVNYNGVVYDISNQTSYTVSQNGRYEFTLQNGIGEQITSSVEVSKIDKVVPSLMVTGNPTTWVSEEFLIHLDMVTGSSGVQQVTVQKTGENRQVLNGNTYLVHENGSYIFQMTNGLGLIVEKTIEVTKLDLVEPKLHITATQETNQKDKMILSIQSEVGASGVQSLRVMRESEEWQDITNQDSYEVKKNGLYTFALTNNLGKQAIVMIPITQIEESLVKDAIIDGKKDTDEDETPKVEPPKDETPKVDNPEDETPKVETSDDDIQKEKPRENESVTGESKEEEDKVESKKLSIVSLAGISEGGQVKEAELPNNPEKRLDRIQDKSIVDNYYDITRDFNSGNFHKKNFLEFNQEEIGNTTVSSMEIEAETDEEVNYGVLGAIAVTPIAGVAVYQTTIVRRRTRLRK